MSDTRNSPSLPRQDADSRPDDVVAAYMRLLSGHDQAAATGEP